MKYKSPIQPNPFKFRQELNSTLKSVRFIKFCVLRNVNGLDLACDLSDLYTLQFLFLSILAAYSKSRNRYPQQNKAKNFHVTLIMRVFFCPPPTPKVYFVKYVLFLQMLNFIRKDGKRIVQGSPSLLHILNLKTDIHNRIKLKLSSFFNQGGGFFPPQNN